MQSVCVSTFHSSENVGAIVFMCTIPVKSVWRVDGWLDHPAIHLSAPDQCALIHFNWLANFHIGNVSYFCCCTVYSLLYAHRWHSLLASNKRAAVDICSNGSRAQRQEANVLCVIHAPHHASLVANYKIAFSKLLSDKFQSGVSQSHTHITFLQTFSISRLDSNSKGPMCGVRMSGRLVGNSTRSSNFHCFWTVLFQRNARIPSQTRTHTRCVHFESVVRGFLGEFFGRDLFHNQLNVWGC